MQKKILIAAVCVLVFAITGMLMYMCFQHNDTLVAYKQKTSIEIINTEIDLGIIKQGLPKTISIPFTNSGNNSLEIYYVETSCGCTEAEWPQKPVKALNKGEIRISYDAKSLGRFFKTITIYGNLQEGSQLIHIKGEVTNNKQATLLSE